MSADDPRLTPRTAELFAVRWIREDGRDVKHRLFTRHHNAVAYAKKIAGYGKAAEVFRAPVGDWARVEGEGS